MPPKSIFRQPGARHFQIVHRSQRDPLIHSADANQQVLKSIERGNAKKGKSRADLEDLLSPSELAHDTNANVGEAALYGVYYDDTEYDYMQHLRTVGVQEDGVESVLIESPLKKTVSNKSKRKDLLDLPEGVLPSESELPKTYESQQAVPESIAGFQPDMDPHLRQALEALEDDAFVDDALGDDFFNELVADGERRSDDDIEFDFHDDEDRNLAEGLSQHKNVDEEAGWEARFAQFKKMQSRGEEDGKSNSDFGSEGGDTVCNLPEMSVIGGKGKKRRKGTSNASGYSMSSSSMYRNDALQFLDDRFDQIISKEYDEEGTEIPFTDDTNDEDEDEAPELITSREDFESMVNEFLNDYEILGRKMKPKLDGESGAEKLDTLRRALGQDERVRIASDDETDDKENYISFDVEDKGDRWDCETILTTYSNLENHPRLIRARDLIPVSKITLDRKTGLPSVTLEPVQSTKHKNVRISNLSESDEDCKTNTPRAVTIARPRDESKEAKKARKSAVKVERQARRVDKKALKEQYGAELKTLKKTIDSKERRLKAL